VDTTYITTEDGKTEIQWWEAEHFYGRSTKIYGGKTFDSMKLETVIPIPDTVILCDFCNTRITEFPVPVMNGSYALCKPCFNDVQKPVK